MKSLGVYYWYAKMLPFKCVEHGLEYITFYVQKHIAHLLALIWTPIGSRGAARDTHIWKTFLLCHIMTYRDHSGYGLSQWQMKLQCNIVS